MWRLRRASRRTPRRGRGRRRHRPPTSATTSTAPNRPRRRPPARRRRRPPPRRRRRPRPRPSPIVLPQPIAPPLDEDGSRTGHRGRLDRDPRDRRVHGDVRGDQAHHARPRPGPLAGQRDAGPHRQRRGRRPPHQQAQGVPQHRQARTGRRDHLRRRRRTPRVPRDADRDPRVPTRCGSSTRRQSSRRRCSPVIRPDRRASASSCSPSSPPESDMPDRRSRRPKRGPERNVAAPPRWRRFKGPVLSLVGGLLVAFSLPPWGFWPLASSA